MKTDRNESLVCVRTYFRENNLEKRKRERIRDCPKNNPKY